MAEKLNISFLGTGSSIPTKNRNHPATLIQYKEQNLLIDCGEGTQRQFRMAKLNPCKITKIFITHWHGDHTLGLPGLLQTLIMNAYNKTLEIHGPKDTKKKIKEIMSFHMGSYLRAAKIEGNTFNIEVFEHSSGKIIETDELKIDCFALDHDTPTIGFTLEIKEKKRIDKKKLKNLKLPNSPIIKQLLDGKIIEFKGKKIDGKKLLYIEPKRKVSFVSDTRYFSDIYRRVKDSDLLIIESTYSKDEADTAKSHGHMTSHDSANIAKKAKVKTLALIHMSQRYDLIPKKLKDEASEVFSGKIITPKDLDYLIL